jgi:Glucose / Sorbosone dehydrogenase
MIRITTAVTVFLCLLGCATAQGAQLQKVGDFEEPIYVTSDPGNPNRLFVVERAGRILLVQGGIVSTFADLRSLVNTEVEDGLLSIALAPDFGSSGRFYLDYTGKLEPGEIHIAEMRAPGGTALPSSLKDVLTIPHPGHMNHNGGQLQFGPEGALFISTGDGGGNNDVHKNAQDKASLLGKILRIEPTPGSVPLYKVPLDNPFVGQAGVREEIWSYGLRNPFRFSFDRLFGGILIGDVGEGAREEVDYGPAPQRGRGANYGWNCREGLVAGPGGDLTPPECATTPFVDPIFDYPHQDPGGGRAFGCAIIGGPISRDSAVPELYGRYVYGDLCEGQVRSLSLADPFGTDRSEGISVPGLNSFGEDSLGRVYAVSGNGSVYRIVEATAPPKRQPFLGLRTSARRVKRGKRVTLTAFVSPCVRSKARSAVVDLYKGRRHLTRRHLSRVCTARFRPPRIRRRTAFRARLVEDTTYLPAQSRRQVIKLKVGRGRG